MFQFPDKSVYKSFTAWAVFLYTVGKAAEDNSFLPAGLTDALQAVIEPASVLFGGLGLRGLAGGLISALRAR